MAPKIKRKNELYCCSKQLTLRRSILFIKRRRGTWNATPHYRLQGESVTGGSVVEAIHTLDASLKKAGVKLVFADNDGNLQPRTSTWGVESLWNIFVEATGKTSRDRGVGGISRWLSQLPLDRSIHNHWKCRKHGGLYGLVELVQSRPENNWRIREWLQKFLGHDFSRSFPKPSKDNAQVIQKVHTNHGSL